jgi:hypothetical protein
MELNEMCTLFRRSKGLVASRFIERKSKAFPVSNLEDQNKQYREDMQRLIDPDRANELIA